MTQVISTNTYGAYAFVVGEFGFQGNFSSIQSAINASGAGDVIWVYPFDASENLTINNQSITINTNLSGNGTFSYRSILSGTIDLLGLSSLNISNFQFTNNSYYSLTINPGEGPCSVSFYNCLFTEANSFYILDDGMPGSVFNFYNCTFNNGVGGGAGSTLFSSSSGATLNFYNCLDENLQNDVDQSQISSDGIVNFYNSIIKSGIEVTSSASINAYYSNFDFTTNSLLNISATSTSNFQYCAFSSGNNICIDCTAPSVINLTTCQLSSSNLTPITGSGTVNLDLLTNLNSSSPIYPTTTTVNSLGISMGNVAVDSLTLKTPPANGTILIGNGSEFAANTLTAGSNITIDNSNPGNITISSSINGYIEENANFTASSNTGYFCSGPLTATLPASPSNGDVVTFLALSFNDVTIQPNSGQFLRVGSSGPVSILNTFYGSSISFVYRNSTSTWVAQYFIGNWTLS